MPKKPARCGAIGAGENLPMRLATSAAEHHWKKGRGMIFTTALVLALTSTGMAAHEPPAPCEPVRCTCMPPPDPQVALVTADAVFIGSVTAVRETSLVLDGVETDIPARQVTLRVHAAWKGVGSADRVVMVLTGHGEGDCGFSFRVGTTYLVYAHRGEDGELSTSICSRTAAAQAAQRDFDALGHPPLVRHQ
jgi:hypothetical protein